MVLFILQACGSDDNSADRNNDIEEESVLVWGQSNWIDKNWK